MISQNLAPIWFPHWPAWKCQRYWYVAKTNTNTNTDDWMLLSKTWMCTISLMVAWLVLGWSAGIDCTCRSAASAAAGRGGGRAGCSTAPHLVPETGKFRELQQRRVLPYCQVVTGQDNLIILQQRRALAAPLLLAWDRDWKIQRAWCKDCSRGERCHIVIR